MPAYEIDKRVSSVFVPLVLLQEIEKYLLKQGESWSTDESQSTFSAIIYDKYGIECIESFDKYYRITLPNDAKIVSLTIRNIRRNFSTEVSFSKSPEYSYIRIKVHGNSAKETAYGIVNTIENHLKEYKNLNFLFYGWHNYILPLLLGFAVGWTLPGLLINSINVSTLIGCFTIVIGLIYYCLKLVNPYSVLDTNKNRQIKSVTKWILNGLAGVFLFGLLAALIRKILLGF